ncbi:hypothetical protein HLASF_3069 (plasmid) [Halanaeroarchaeum sulfurireducens]|uniref:Uncharacterized protein n=1 Tax=Halanaeroarchaeum sulfurireducens TaxID=1604004 RepID=A0A0F7PER7_9EURY|nr:hypothetical protein HLASF_3069 [Halanaeroarchaeum sulfurireducens]
MCRFGRPSMPSRRASSTARRNTAKSARSMPRSPTASPPPVRVRRGRHRRLQPELQALVASGLQLQRRPLRRRRPHRHRGREERSEKRQRRPAQVPERASHQEGRPAEDRVRLPDRAAELSRTT